MPSDPLAARRLDSYRAVQREAADTDLEILDGLLAVADDFRSAVLAAAPYLNIRGARAALAGFADGFDDLMGDTLRGARRAADDALDDASPMPPPGRAA